MSERPYVVRKWTEGLRVVAEASEVGGDTYDNKQVLPRLIEAIDPAAGARYREQMRNRTLRIFRVLKADETDRKYAVFHVSFTEGSDFPNHYHKLSQATILVIEGEGHVILDGERFAVAAGDVVHIPPGVAHEFFVGRDGQRFTYLSITEPDIILDADRGQVDWYTLPSGRYADDGRPRDP